MSKRTIIWRYKVISASSADDLAQHINKSCDGEWELVPGQSITVVSFSYYEHGRATDTMWSYTVMMRMLS